MSPLFVAANVAEAGLWLALAGVVLVRWRQITAAAVLLAFGASDLVETQTGAWWRPWWLLAWKVTCVAVLVVLLVRAAFAERRRRASGRT